MHIRDIELRISPVNAGVVLIFSVFLVLSFVTGGNATVLFYGIPMLLALLLIPLALNYMSQTEYADLLPGYEKDAQKVRIRAINPNMLGKPVRVEGVVERISFRYLNRPQFLVGDRTGEISVKMFTTPSQDIKKGDVVDVLGQVMRRYIVTGDPVINCVSIRKRTAENPKK
ncbi:MAG TPA: nucleotide-binding protein [Methanomicrobiales archaeon]|nr:nucleotide-binding protein [Methanomicrobiales archaeon]